jgi:hypothetical protein
MNKVGSLPWDEWGRMTEAYDGQTGPDYDDTTAVSALYAHENLRVPDALVIARSEPATP